jgi:membrane fusion protein, multidrug efflux system
LGKAAVVENPAMNRAVLLLVTAACGGQPVSRATESGTETGSLPATPPIAITTADTATVLVPLTLPTQLYVEHDATIYARSPGIVESILVDLGSRVTGGQLLARLESIDQRIALAQAQEKFVITRQIAERQRALKAGDFITQADSEQAEFDHREAVLALRKAQRDYDLTRIIAPFAGVVTGRMTRVHRLVSSGDSLFRITALKPVLAAIHVPESSAAKITVGTQAEIVGPGGTKVAARVIRASPVLDAGSGTRELILQLTSSGSGLTPGSNVMVRLGAERRQVIAIPRTAVAQDGYALVWADDKTTLRPVTLGSELDGNRVEVLSGLTPGEKVLRNAP